MYQEAVTFVKEAGQASISGLQIEFDIGYQRAAKLIKQMEDRGILGKRERYNRPMTVLLDQ